MKKKKYKVINLLRWILIGIGTGFSVTIVSYCVSWYDKYKIAVAKEKAYTKLIEEEEKEKEKEVKPESWYEGEEHKYNIKLESWEKR